MATGMRIVTTVILSKPPSEVWPLLCSSKMDQLASCAILTPPDHRLARQSPVLTEKGGVIEVSETSSLNFSGGYARG